MSEPTEPTTATGRAYLAKSGADPAREIRRKAILAIEAEARAAREDTPLSVERLARAMARANGQDAHHTAEQAEEHWQSDLPDATRYAAEYAALSPLDAAREDAAPSEADRLAVELALGPTAREDRIQEPGTGSAFWRAAREDAAPLDQAALIEGIRDAVLPNGEPCPNLECHRGAAQLVERYFERAAREDAALTAAVQELRGTVIALRSFVRSGERLTETDEAEIERTLERSAAALQHTERAEP